MNILLMLANGLRELISIATIPLSHSFTSPPFSLRFTDNQNNTYELDPALAQQHSLADEWRALAPGARTHVVGSVEDAVLYAVERAERSGEKGVQVLTTGSLILVGNQLAVMGIEPM